MLNDVETSLTTSMTELILEAAAKFNKEDKEMKTYKILFNGKRYNTKNFSHYEEARAYVRRLVTRLYGGYSDSYTQYGFKVEKIA